MGNNYALQFDPKYTLGDPEKEKYKNAPEPRDSYFRKENNMNGFLQKVYNMFQKKEPAYAKQPVELYDEPMKRTELPMLLYSTATVGGL